MATWLPSLYEQTMGELSRLSASVTALFCQHEETVTAGTQPALERQRPQKLLQLLGPGPLSFFFHKRLTLILYIMTGSSPSGSAAEEVRGWIPL